MSAAVVLLMAAQGGVVASAAVAKPSIVFVLADDLGYNEMGFMNGTRGLISPNLDALAHTGIILKNYCAWLIPVPAAQPADRRHMFA